MKVAITDTFLWRRERVSLCIETPRSKAVLTDRKRRRWVSMDEDSSAWKDQKDSTKRSLDKWTRPMEPLYSERAGEESWLWLN